MSPLRPLGYFLWGLLWLVLAVSVLAVPPFVVYASLFGQMTGGGEGNPITVALVWVIGVPLCAWLFIVLPFAIVSQALTGFVASGLALQEKYRSTQIVEFVGSARYRTMEPRINTPALRLLAAIEAVGTIPGRVFAISALVITFGLGILIAVHGPVGALVSLFIVMVGAGGALVGIRTRINEELKKAPPSGRGQVGLTEKYYKGLRYRESKRARDLQKARDAGRAGDIDTWGRAEAEHALRTYGSAAYAARKGVPGALDAAFADVFTAMDGAVTRQQAEQFVIDAAAYRGKKPVPVPVSTTR